MHAPMLVMLFLSSFGLSSCVTILPNTTECRVAGVLAAGMDCAETLTPNTKQMTLDETIEFLEPQAEKIDPETGAVIPARPGALCRSAEDFRRQKDVLEILCNKAGNKCTKEIKTYIQRLQ